MKFCFVLLVCVGCIIWHVHMKLSHFALTLFLETHTYIPRMHVKHSMCLSGVWVRLMMCVTENRCIQLLTFVFAMIMKVRQAAFNVHTRAHLPYV